MSFTYTRILSFLLSCYLKLACCLVTLRIKMAFIINHQTHVSRKYAHSLVFVAPSWGLGNNKGPSSIPTFVMCSKILICAPEFVLGSVFHCQCIELKTPMIRAPSSVGRDLCSIYEGSWILKGTVCLYSDHWSVSTDVEDFNPNRAKVRLFILLLVFLLYQHKLAIMIQHLQ